MCAAEGGLRRGRGVSQAPMMSSRGGSEEGAHKMTRRRKAAAGLSGGSQGVGEEVDQGPASSPEGFGHIAAERARPMGSCQGAGGEPEGGPRAVWCGL
eukprot:941854-Prorocentrum_minimum.AAC.1